MKREKMVYMFQCIECKVNFLTEDVAMFHCGRLTQWVSGIDGKGITMSSPIVKIQVSGFITMSKENLDRIMSYDPEDIHMGLVYSLHMGYVDTENLVFDTPD